MRKRLIAAISLTLAIIIGLSVGLGVGLTRSKSGNKTTENAGLNSTLANDTSSFFWNPRPNTTWDYQLQLPPDTFNASVEVYDIDLFDSNITLIEDLHSLNHRVICYFSAGSYEDWRPDKDNFTSADLGNNLDGWEGEKWVDTNSDNVRHVMANRLLMAARKKCDGVDPDNIDAYDNDSGFKLTENDAVDYIGFLSRTAHALNLSMGLKNGGAVVERVVGAVQWVVVEQCIQYDECDLYEPFLKQDKPVFNVEYPEEVRSYNEESFCRYNGSVGFMTILKHMDLDAWVEICPFR